MSGERQIENPRRLQIFFERGAEIAGGCSQTSDTVDFECSLRSLSERG